MNQIFRGPCGRVPVVIALSLLAVISWSVGIVAQAPPTSATLTEWDLFAGTGGNVTASQNVSAVLMDVSGIAGPAGNVWATTQNPQPRLGRLDPGAGSSNYVEWVPVPAPLVGGATVGLALNRSNADIWVAMQGDPAFVLKLGAGNSFRHFRSTYSFVPHGVTVASDNSLIAAVPFKNAGALGNAIIKIPRDPLSGQVTVSMWNVAGEPHHVALDNSGNIWFSEKSANKLARLNPATALVTEWLLPSGTKPMGVDVRGGVVCVASEGAAGALSGVVNCLDSTSNQLTVYARAAGDGFDLPQQTAVNSDTETFITEQNGNSVSFVSFAARTSATVTTVTPTTRTVAPKTTKLNVTNYTVTPVMRTIPSTQTVMTGIDNGSGYVRFTLPLVAQTFPFEQFGNPQPVGLTPVFNDLGRGTGSVFFGQFFDGPVLGRTPGGRVGRLAIGGAPPTSTTIVTNPASLQFDSVVGGAAPGPQAVAITEASGSALTWTATKTAPWLTLSPNTGAAPSSMTVTANPASLAAGSYTDTITVDDGPANATAKTIAVTLNVTGAPTISLTPGSLTFQATAGGGRTAPETVDITNSGSGALAWTATPSAAWIIVGPTSGTAPSTLSVRVDPVSLGGGTHNGSITITAPGATNSPRTLTVTASLIAPPVITPSQDSLVFSVNRGSDPASQIVRITNSGGGTLTFSPSVSASAPGGWLTVSPSGQTSLVSGAFQDFTVSVASGSLLSGNYNGSIAVTDALASNSPLSVPVSLTVSPRGELGASPTSFVLSALKGGANPANQLVTIDNGGDAALSYTTGTPSASWLTVAGGGNGTVDGSGTATLALGINISGLAKGTYEATVVVTSSNANNASQTITVNVTVEAPTISTPTSVSHSVKRTTTLASQTVAVSNTGDADLHYTASVQPGATWLTITAGATGTVAPGGAGGPGVQYTINTASPVALTSGSYTGTIQIADPNASNSPHTITVNLTVTPASTLSVSPTGLPLTVVGTLTSPPNQTITVSNTGDSALNYTATVTAGASWLSISSGGSGTVAPAGGASLALALNTVGLARGVYVGTIEVSDPNATNLPQTVTMTLTVTAPIITPDQPSLSFGVNRGNNPAMQTLRITNTGDAALTFTPSLTASAPGGWLAVSPSGPVSIAAGSFQNFTVTVTSSALAAATYNGSFTVTDGDAATSPQTIPMTLTVNPYGTLSPSATAFNVTAVRSGANPANQVVTLSNTGDAALSYTTDTPSAAWLTVASGDSGPVNVGGNASLSLAINVAGLAKGSYSATVQVLSANANGSPQTATVNLTVQAPTIVLSPASIPLTVVRTLASPANQTVGFANTGDATLNYAASVTGGASWLSIISGGSGAVAPGASGHLVLALNSTGLAKGVYVGTVQVTDSSATNSPQTVTVTLTVTAPIITADQASLTFTANRGGNSPTQTLRITNTGNTTLAFTPSISASAPGGWLTLSPSGPVSIPGGGNSYQDFTVTATSAALSSAAYSGSITIADATAANSPFTVPVTLTVNAFGTLTMSQTSVTVTATKGGANPAYQLVTLGNGGDAAFSYTTGTPSATWLTIAGGGSGTVNPSGSSTLSLAVNIAGLAKGNYSATVQVASANATSSPQTVTVSLTVRAPIISVPPSVSHTVKRTTTLAAQTVSVSNTGDASLNYTASVQSGATWLTIVGGATGTVAPGNSASPALQYTINTASPVALTSGNYTGTIQIADSNALNSLQTITVNLTVSAASTISLSSAVMSFSASQGSNPSPAVQTVTVSNTGDLNLTFTPQKLSGAAWLGVTPAGQVTVTPTGSQMLTFTVTSSSLAPGNYTETVRIADGNATNNPRDITVNLTVAAQAVMTLTPASLTNYSVFRTKNPSPNTQTITLQNTGSSTMTSWTATASMLQGSGWLSVSPASGTNLAAGASVTLTVTVSSSALSVGTFNGSISIAAAGTPSGNSPQARAIQVVVNPAPAIMLSATTQMNFAGNKWAMCNAVPLGNTIANQSYTVANTGDAGSTLNFMAAASTSSGGAWLVVSPTSGVDSTANASPVVAVTASIDLTPGGTPLGAGTYTGSIAVADPNASNSGAATNTRTVQLTVGSSLATLCVSPASLAFGNIQRNTTSPSQMIVFRNVGETAFSGSWSSSKTDSSGTVNRSPNGGPALAAGASVNITVSVDASGGSDKNNLPQNGSVTFTRSGALNNGVSVPITWTQVP